MTAAASTARRIQPRSRWRFPDAPPAELVDALVRDLNLPPAVCRLLAIRGFTTADPAKTWLRPRLDQLRDPSELIDLDKAVARLIRAIRDHETIMVHGDYDVDGICSTTLLTKTLRSLGGQVVPFIPRRLQDGYDLGAAGAGAAKAAGAKVVLACDCGTSAIKTVEELQSSGIDVIIADHHLPSGPVAPAYALINPKRPDCPSQDKDAAAVGLSFKLALGLVRAMGASENPVMGMLDLVALATIADVAPLRGENRIFVRYGLRLLNETPNVGLRMLIRAAGLSDKPITAGRVGFILAPRLNATGRLGHALRGVELLLAESEMEAAIIARELEELNARRQEVDRATHARAREMVEAMDLDTTWGIVLAEHGWHAGVIGIVASRIVEEYCRPTVLVALEGLEGKGSGRSVSAFDLHAGLSGCRDLLLRFGGHKAAAGITIAADRVKEFSQRFNEVARERLTPDDLVHELRVDLEVTLPEIDLNLDAMLRHLEPCGVGNPAPVLVARNVRLGAAPRVVGQEHLKLLLQSDGTSLDTIGFGMGPRAQDLKAGDIVDVAFRLERDEWNGQQRLQGRLADFRPSSRA